MGAQVRPPEQGLVSVTRWIVLLIAVMACLMLGVAASLALGLGVTPPKKDPIIRLTNPSQIVCAPYAVRNPRSGGPDLLKWECVPAEIVATWILYGK